jgi:hypothetical protein
MGSIADFQLLIDNLVPFAVQCLTRYQGFAPFGCIITTQGEQRPIIVGEDTISSEMPYPEYFLRILEQGFIRGARDGNYRAVATAYEVFLDLDDRRVSTIVIHMEHRCGISLKKYFCYTMVQSCVHMDETYEVDCEMTIFK